MNMIRKSNVNNSFEGNWLHEFEYKFCENIFESYKKEMKESLVLNKKEMKWII